MSAGPARPAHAERALAALYRYDRDRPYVTYAFLALCLLVTIPTLLRPALYDVLGGIEPRRYPWQPFTAAFEHGWPGFHGSIHLALNTFLILECGRPCERLLGRGRFLVLGLLAWVANAVAVSLTEGVNGSSLVIWAWGPPLFVAWLWAKRRDATATPGGRRLAGILVLMYGIIVLAMTFIPYLYGWRGNPLSALLRGNLYHLVAVGVGTGFALYSAGHVRNRMATLGR